MTLEQISVTACPTCGALAQQIAGDTPTWRHIDTAGADPTAELAELLDKWTLLACDLAQLLDGWHNDGTAWSEWDESVRQRLSALQSETERSQFVRFLKRAPEEIAKWPEWKQKMLGIK